MLVCMDHWWNFRLKFLLFFHCHILLWMSWLVMNSNSGIKATCIININGSFYMWSRLHVVWCVDEFGLAWILWYCTELFMYCRIKFNKIKLGILFWWAEFMVNYFASVVKIHLVSRLGFVEAGFVMWLQIINWIIIWLSYSSINEINTEWGFKISNSFHKQCEFQTSLATGLQNRFTHPPLKLNKYMIFV